ncbi:MAG: c-type cytochrome, partial [Bacteroidales bacterium]|nr:c-type cytochrome [Bacteroidales bacterium]
TTVLLDNVDRGAANPWAVTCSDDGQHLIVTHAGSQEVSLIDRPALHQKIADSDNPDFIPNDLSFMYTVRQLVPLIGNGPRAVVAAGDKVLVAEYFTDSIGVVDLDTGQALASIPLGETVAMTQERLGEMYFNDASLCFQKWQSCATCHPDSRADGLNWDLLNDGMGNAKNSRSLLRSHETPPVMITGIRPNAETAVRAGIRFIQFVVRPDEDAQALDAYLRSMEPVTSPYLVEGQLSDAAIRGQQLFADSGCALCHNGRNYTNMKTYNVGTGTGREAGREFDTPTLIEVWRTAPYLYDGRAHTMMDVLRDFNTDDQHGMTSHLSEAELTDLATYILSL